MSDNKSYVSFSERVEKVKCYGYPTGKLLRVVRKPTGGTEPQTKINPPSGDNRRSEAMNGKVARGGMTATTEARVTLSSGGTWNPTDVMPLTSINGVPIAMLPAQLDRHCDQWLSSNRQERGQTLHGLFPIGMVQRWIERAEQAEAKLLENAT